MNRLAATAFLAMVCLGLTSFAPNTQAQGGAAQTSQLNADGLVKMLEGMGYEPKKSAGVVLISINKEGWVFNMHFELSQDGTRIGLNSILGTVPNLAAVTAAQWMGLLADNNSIDPSCFVFDRAQKTLYMHRVVDNRALTPAYLRHQIDKFCANIRMTEPDWKFVN